MHNTFGPKIINESKMVCFLFLHMNRRELLSNNLTWTVHTKGAHFIRTNEISSNCIKLLTTIFFMAFLSV